MYKNKKLLIIMDKSIYSKLLNKKPLISKPPINNDHSQHEMPQSTENNENNIDYRNISLTLTGEISSSCIHRDNLIQKQPNNVMFVEDTEDDDEQFISNMKQIIDKNYKMQNKENHNVRDLQSKSYLSKKKKCIFSDEDQNLIKRFKKSVNESKVLQTTSQKPQHSENVASINNSKCSITTSTPKTTSTVTLSKSNTDFNRNDTNQFLSYIISQKSDQSMPKNTGIVTQTEIVKTEIEQFLYCDMLYYLTPPQTDK